MVEAYRIGVALQLSSNLITGIERSIRALERMDRMLREVRRSLTEMDRQARRMSELAGSMDRLTRGGGRGSSGNQMSAIRAQAEMEDREHNVRMRNLRQEAEYQNREFDARANKLRREAEFENQEHTSRMRQLRQEAEFENRGMGGGRGGTGHGASGWHSIMRDVEHVGIGASIAGGGILSLSREAFNQASDVGHLREMLIQGNRGMGLAGPGAAYDRALADKRADEAVERARDATRQAPGTTTGQNLEAILRIANVTGNLPEAEATALPFAKLSAVLQVADRKKGGTGDPAYAAAKAADILGEMVEEKTDPKTGKITRDLSMSRLINFDAMMSSIAVRTEGNVGPEDYLKFAKMGELPGMRMDDSMKFQVLPAMMMALSPSRLGTMFTSLEQVVVGDRMTDKTYEQMVKGGLAAPMTRVRERNKKTGKMEWALKKPGVYDQELMQTNLLEWVTKSQDRMFKAGIKTPEQQMDFLQKASQRSTYARLLADLIKDERPIRNEMQQLGLVQNELHKDPDMLFRNIEAHDPKAKMLALSAAWDRFLLAFSGPAMDKAIGVISSLTNGLNALSGWAEKHPDTAAKIYEVATALGALAAVAGALSIASFLFAPAFKGVGAIGRMLGFGAGAAAATAIPGSIMPGTAAPKASGLLGGLGSVLFGWSANQAANDWAKDLAKKAGGAPIHGVTGLEAAIAGGKSGPGSAGSQGGPPITDAQADRIGDRAGDKVAAKIGDLKLYLDKQVVGQAAASVQARELQRPLAGPSNTIMRMHPISPVGAP